MALQQASATIVATYGRQFLLETADEQRVLCVSRGKKSQIVVGDQVLWSMSHDAGVIEQVLPRKNVFYRQDAARTKVFAANLDLIILLLAAEPEYSERQLTRTLVAAEAAAIPLLIVLNKADLTTLFERTWQRLQAYQNCGYKMLRISVLEQPQQVIAQLQPWLLDKTSLVVGASGVGKSSLINLLVPAAKIKTNEISLALNSGKHTTTSTTLYWLHDLEQISFSPNKKAAIIDSPGFQEFGLMHIAAKDLINYFPDLSALIDTECKFYNCSHIHEPHCALQNKIQTDALKRRYAYFQELHAELSNNEKNPRY